VLHALYHDVPPLASAVVSGAQYQEIANSPFAKSLKLSCALKLSYERPGDIRHFFATWAGVGWFCRPAGRRTVKREIKEEKV
jgi:hypothetical protein